jgi:acyl carrier protein
LPAGRRALRVRFDLIGDCLVWRSLFRPNHALFHKPKPNHGALRIQLSPVLSEAAVTANSNPVYSSVSSMSSVVSLFCKIGWLTSPSFVRNVAALFAMTDADLRTRIKEMMVKNLMLQITADQIADDAPLFGPNGIGLDSIDALELAVGLEKNFGVSVTNSEIATKVLRSVNTIHDYILEKRGESAQS